jgi:hypothetical protein
MKKIILIAAASVLASSAFAQGLLNWNTSTASGSTIKYGSSAGFGALAGTVYDGTFAGSNPLQAGIWVGAAGAGEGSLQLVAGSVKTVGVAGPSKGNVVGMSSYAISGFNYGSVVSLQIRAWSGASYGAGSVAGKSGLTQITLGGPAPTPSTVAWSTAGVAASSSWNAIAPTGSGPLQGFTLSIVPEPASASLLGLGLASLLIFRRRK